LDRISRAAQKAAMAAFIANYKGADGKIDYAAMAKDLHSEQPIVHGGIGRFNDKVHGITLRAVLSSR